MLHVGGDESDHHVLAALLHGLAHEIEVHFVAAVEAVEALQARTPDLLFLDVAQPSHDVVQLLRAAAPAGTSYRVPVIMIAPEGMNERVVACLKRGAEDYLLRPFDPSHPILVQRRVDLALQRRNLRDYGVKLLTRTNPQANETAVLPFDSKTIEREAKRQAEANAKFDDNPFFPKEFLGHLDRRTSGEVKLGDFVQRDMTLLFTDIRDFTHLSETLTPRETFKFLTSYTGYLTPIIRRHHGFVERYLGDGLMALFNGKSTVADALRAGIDIIKEVKRYNQGRRRARYEPIVIGVGLHRGTLILGTIGERTHMQTTVIADAVNLASRIEGMTKTFGVPLLVSSAVVDTLPADHPFHVRHLGAVKAKGKTQSVDIYECFETDSPALLEHKETTLPQFAVAMGEFRKGMFLSAGKIFQRIAEMNEEDVVAAYFRDRCTLSMVRERGRGRWDGAEQITVK